MGIFKTKNRAAAVRYDNKRKKRAEWFRALPIDARRLATSIFSDLHAAGCLDISAYGNDDRNDFICSVIARRLHNGGRRIPTADG